VEVEDRAEGRLLLGCEAAHRQRARCRGQLDVLDRADLGGGGHRLAQSRHPRPDLGRPHLRERRRPRLAQAAEQLLDLGIEGSLRVVLPRVQG